MDFSDYEAVNLTDVEMFSIQAVSIIELTTIGYYRVFFLTCVKTSRFQILFYYASIAGFFPITIFIQLKIFLGIPALFPYIMIANSLKGLKNLRYHQTAQ